MHVGLASVERVSNRILVYVKAVTPGLKWQHFPAEPVGISSGVAAGEV